MKVILNKNLFDDPSVDDSILLEIIWEAEHGRHLVFVEDSDSSVDGWLDSEVDVWLNKFGEASKERALFGLSESYVEVVTTEPTLEVCVTTAGDNWDSLALSPEKARDFLRRPLEIWFENDVHDSSFLVSCCNPDLSKSLSFFEQKGWVVFRNAGGISSMPQRVNSVTPETKWKLMFLFDSDSLIPEVCGKQAEKIQSACIDKDISFHCLERRAIENYIPPKTLGAWAYKPSFRGGEKRRLRRAFDAYKQLTLAQRSTFAVKSGFSGDRKLVESKHWVKRKDQIIAHYDSVSSSDKVNLASGFQETVAKQIFGTIPIPYGEIVDDGASEEIDKAALTIINGV